MKRIVLTVTILLLSTVFAWAEQIIKTMRANIN